MAKCIEKLNVKGIYVMYVYDALYCKESDSKVVKEVMNDVILENGVFSASTKVIFGMPPILKEQESSVD